MERVEFATIARSAPIPSFRESAAHMLGIVAVVLVVLWLLGFLAFHVGGGLIHLLLVIAVVMIVLHVVTGRHRL